MHHEILVSMYRSVVFYNPTGGDRLWTRYSCDYPAPCDSGTQCRGRLKLIAARPAYSFDCSSRKAGLARGDRPRTRIIAWRLSIRAAQLWNSTLASVNLASFQRSVYWPLGMALGFAIPRRAFADRSLPKKGISSTASHHKQWLHRRSCPRIGMRGAV